MYRDIIVITLINIVISNFMTLDELTFYFAIQSFAIVLTGFMLFFGLMMIHEYSVAKNIVTLIATILAIAVILFIIFLMATLFQQIYGFIMTVWDEFKIRYF